MLQLTKPVLELLDRVSTLGSTDLANAKVMAANMSTAVKKMSDAIQSAAVEQIDKIQANYLGGSGSAAEATGRLSKAVHIINNVSLRKHTRAEPCRVAYKSDQTPTAPVQLHAAIDF